MRWCVNASASAYAYVGKCVWVPRDIGASHVAGLELRNELFCGLTLAFMSFVTRVLCLCVCVCVCMCVYLPAMISFAWSCRHLFGFYDYLVYILIYIIQGVPIPYALPRWLFDLRWPMILFFLFASLYAFVDLIAQQL